MINFWNIRTHASIL